MTTNNALKHCQAIGKAEQQCQFTASGQAVESTWTVKQGRKMTMVMSLHVLLFDKHTVDTFCYHFTMMARLNGSSDFVDLQGVRNWM